MKRAAHPYGKVPGAAEWAGYESDLDVKDAHRLMFGKAVPELANERYFGGTLSIGRADELLFMPRKAFQYYVFAFAGYLMTEAARGDPDSANPFLVLLIEREKRDPGSVAQIFAQLERFVEYVASGQAHFDADEDIYGNFAEKGRTIRQMCGA